MSKQLTKSVNTEKQADESTNSNHLIHQLRKAAGEYYFYNKSPEKVKNLWDSLSTTIKKEFFDKGEGTWIIFQYAAGFNDIEFMEECWGYAGNKVQRAQLLKGYFYGAYSKAAQNNCKESLEKLWEYAQEVKTQDELLAMSLTRAAQKAAENGHTFIILDIWNQLSSLGSHGLKYKIDMLKSGSKYADGSVTGYKALWKATENEHTDTAAVLLYLCKNTIKDFDEHEAFNNISTTGEYNIEEPFFLMAVTCAQLLNNIADLTISNTSHAINESSSEALGLAVEDNQSVQSHL